MPDGKINRLKSLIFIKPAMNDSLFVEIEPRELRNQLAYKAKKGFFLNRFERAELLRLLGKEGVSVKLKEMGFTDHLLVIDLRAPFEHRIRMYDRAKKNGNLLVELVVKEGIFEPNRDMVSSFFPDDVFLLMIEWLCLQNPRKIFNAEQRRLPGQKYPGLGVLKNFEGFLKYICSETGCEGILNIPEYYHGALMYSARFFFLVPEIQGRFEALKRDLESISLDRASYAALCGCVLNRATGDYETWEGNEQLLPLTERLMDYFASADYRGRVKRAREESSFHIDEEKFVREASIYFDLYGYDPKSVE